MIRSKDCEIEWGWIGSPSTSANTHSSDWMSHIRHKPEPDPSQPIYFITEPGMGYRFLRSRTETSAP
jgi:DNA-binding response OmpR family regulator